MLPEFKKHIETHFSFLKESKVLVAVSGGIDSVVLTHLIHQCGLDYAMCHCNFKLRADESDEDESFVKDLAKTLGVHIFSTSFKTEKYAEEHKLSIQVAARNLRYEWFYKLLKEHQFDYVLTAHNTNDNLETFIINFTRGTGLEGLTGIPPMNDKSVRPLLAFSRDDIMMYAIKNEITWREDRSNASIKYVRNKVRHQILPILQEINPHLLETFKSTVDHLNESQAIVNDTADQISKECLIEEKDHIKIDLAKLEHVSNKKAYLYQLLNQYEFTEWNDVFGLISAQPGKHVFSKTHRLLKDREHLILTVINHDLDAQKSFTISESTSEIQAPIRLSFEKTTLDFNSNSNEILLDKDLLKYPLGVRKWGYGDYICPIGMKGSKKLSQLFKDKKLSLFDKEKIWLLTDAEDAILWVIGMRQDRRFIAKESTQNRLKISYKL